MHDYRGYLEGLCPPDADWGGGPDLDAQALIDSYFNGLTDEKLRTFDPGFSDKALMTWDGHFAPEGLLYLFGTRGKAIDIEAYRQCALKHMVERGLLGPRQPCR